MVGFATLQSSILR